MNSRIPISYRPSIERKELESLITKKLHYKALNRFIDEAVKEKLTRELEITSDPEMAKLVSKLTEVIYEHNSWKFLKPNKAIIDRIDQKAKGVESGKVKAVRWKGSIEKS